jgi:hypothetical protein
MGRTEIRIDANGRGIYQSGSRGLRFDGGQRFQDELFRYNFALNETEILALLQNLNNSGFYTLNDSYVNPHVRDGGSEFISVTLNNSTKSVGVMNTRPPDAYLQAARLIEGIAINKTH